MDVGVVVGDITGVVAMGVVAGLSWKCVAESSSISRLIFE